jgi:hypothetical protein
MLYALKVKGTDWYLPKTPYTEEEMSTNLLTNKPERINKFKRRGNAERSARECPINPWNPNDDREWEIVEFNS